MAGILDEIKNEEIDFRVAEEGIVSRTYITENFVVQERTDDVEKLRKNAVMIDRLYENGVNAPELIELGEDPVFAVFEKLEGDSLDKKQSFDEKQYFEAVRNSGKALAQIHQQEGSGYGKPTPETDFTEAPFSNWHEFVEDYAQGTLDYVESEKFRHVAEKAFEKFDSEALPENPESRVLHMDYTPDNIIVREDMEVDVIDFDGVYFGDPGLDLVYAEMIMSKYGEKMAEEFMQGYRQVRDPDLTQEEKKNYTALAAMRDVRGAEWCLKNDKDVDLEEWREGLEGTLEQV